MTSDNGEAFTPGRGGRTPITTTARISHVAFELFVTQGYENTTVDQIAEACGIGRRTLFRYFPSKNDIPWGDFDSLLHHFQQVLRQTDPQWPLHEALKVAIIEFNTFPPEETLYHRKRMDLLLSVPSLLGHSTLRYEGWRQVIQEFVSERLGVSPDSLEARLIAWVSLGISLASYELWLADPYAHLPDLLAHGFDTLESLLEARGVSLSGR